VRRVPDHDDAGGEPRERGDQRHHPAAFDNFRATAQYVDCPPGVPVPPRVRK
jgi:hypothetical protein